MEPMISEATLSVRTESCFIEKATTVHVSVVNTFRVSLGGNRSNPISYGALLHENMAAISKNPDNSKAGSLGREEFNRFWLVGCG